MTIRSMLLGLAVPVASLSILAASAGDGPVSILAVLILSPLLVMALVAAIALTRPSRIGLAPYVVVAVVAGAQLAALATFSVSDDPGELGSVVVPLGLGVLNAVVSLPALLLLVADSSLRDTQPAPRT